MFTGSEIIGEEESSPRDACVAQGSSGSLLVKFKRSDNYRLIIKRVQPFKTFEVSLVKSRVVRMLQPPQTESILFHLFHHKYSRPYSNTILDRLPRAQV